MRTRPKRSYHYTNILPTHALLGVPYVEVIRLYALVSIQRIV